MCLRSLPLCTDFIHNILFSTPIMAVSHESRVNQLTFNACVWANLSIIAKAGTMLKFIRILLYPSGKQ